MIVKLCEGSFPALPATLPSQWGADTVSRLRIEPWRPTLTAQLTLPAGASVTNGPSAAVSAHVSCLGHSPPLGGGGTEGDLPIVLNLGSLSNILRYSHTINMIHHGSWQQPFRTSSLHGGS